MTLARLCFLLGGVSSALSVMCGAFAAHALKSAGSDRAVELFKTASTYQLSHALALVLVGVLARSSASSGALSTASICFIAGTVLFCGSLYILGVTDVRWVGALTPLGGLSFICGWLALAWWAVRAPQ